jgi:hypothetical protein
MHKDNEYQKGDLVSFKLVNGDEIVARITESTTTGWSVSKPCTVIPSQQGLGLLQSLFSADINKDIVLKREHVMLHSPTIQALESHYIKTTTGIETVSKGSIIT